MRIRPALVWLLMVLCVAAGERSWPALSDATASTYPAFDRHKSVAIAADPFDTDNKRKLGFPGINFNRTGVEGIRLIISNDSDEALDLRRATYELTLQNGSQATFVPENDAEAELLRHRIYADSADFAGVPQIGIPIPKGIFKRSTNLKEQQRGFESRLFKTRMIPPGARESGFIFFNTGDELKLLDRCTLVVSNVYLGDSTTPLFYFEIHLKD